MQYEVRPEDVKETIVINKNTENTYFEFNINAKDLSVKLQADKSIVFYDVKNPSKKIFAMDAPYMIDAKNQQSNDIEVGLTQTMNGYILSLAPNKEWLDSNERVYPIELDPTVTTNLGITSIQDTFVSSSQPDTNYYKYNTGDTNKNKLQLESKLQKPIMNILKNHNAEVNSDWLSQKWGTSDGSGSYDTTNKYLGNQSLKITKTNIVERPFYSQQFSFEKAGIAEEQGAVEDVGTSTKTATSYFDCLQLEEGSAANRYNLIENPNFIYGTSTPSFRTKNYECTTSDTLVTATSAENAKYSFTYDGAGNPLTARVEGANDAATFTESKSTYSANGNYIKTIEDSLGNTVIYNYDEAKRNTRQCNR